MFNLKQLKDHLVKPEFLIPQRELTRSETNKIKKWVKALRSGEYKQTKKRLQDKTGYCCLGVACKVLIPKYKQKTENGILEGELPSDQVSDNFLEFINIDFREVIGVLLSDLNDNYNFTFDEIADLLELVYIHKALHEE